MPRGRRTADFDQCRAAWIEAYAAVGNEVRRIVYCNRIRTGKWHDRDFLRNDLITVVGIVDGYGYPGILSREVIDASYRIHGVLLRSQENVAGTPIRNRWGSRIGEIASNSRLSGRNGRIRLCCDCR